MSPDTSTPTVLAQILSDVRATGVHVTDILSRTAVVEQLVRELHSNDADHESRLRALEQTRPDLLTRGDYDRDQAEQAAHRAARNATRTRWYVAVGSAVVAFAVPAWTLAINYWLLGVR